MNDMIIGVDWGTSNLRAFRFDETGAVQEVRRANLGVALINDGAFETTLAHILGDWLEGGHPRIFIAGMAGGRGGWRETPYLLCPSTADQIAGALERFQCALGDISIVPGLWTKHALALDDVMRGEETQILGADIDGDATVVLPGTHSKWARLSNGIVTSFRSFITGEMFALIREHAFVGRLIDGDEHNADAFDAGVAVGLSRTTLLNTLFSVRSSALLSHIAPESLSSYLSGLLIGAEIADGGVGDSGAPLFVIGANHIPERYVRALALADITDVKFIDSEEASARGLWRIANRSL